MKIVFIPIDNRPVCYQMPKMIADINRSIELHLPPKELLGGLKEYANVKGLFEWLNSNINNADAVILSLDTIAYGGLIPSRRSTDTFDEIKNRVETLIGILKKSEVKTYAFSSVMRISNNNVNEEEKEYWNKYGEKIFKYSYETDKFGTAVTDVPKGIIDDYLKTRKRNFEINKLYLKYKQDGIFDTLIFSKDDCAEYGLNVKEARELESMGGFTKTGADEIPLTLLARSIDSEIKVHPIFMEQGEKHLISNYEDVSVEKSVLGQLELAGCKITSEKDADILLYVNNFKNHQGEIVMKRQTELFNGIWEKPNKPYAVADVRQANGADNNFISKLFDTDLGENFFGYAGWNTTANTLGSIICAMKFVYSAKKENSFSSEAFKKLEAVRFLDDWAYQANVRQELKSLDISIIKVKMKKYENIVKNKLGTEFEAKYSYPWNRLFEVEVELN